MSTDSFPNKTIILKLPVPALACLAAMLAQAPVFAQTDQAADTMDADDLVLEEVIVTGIRNSLDTAADIKRQASQVVDAISAEDIGLFSDNNIGEALQRIPGVQLERDAGEGFRISIRGLGPRFVRTTVNGRTALSTAGGEDGNAEDSRGFTMNTIPSEVISRVTVEKSTQAKNLEGGIGGTLDLQTNRALNFADKVDQDFYISAAGRVGYNDLVDDPSTRVSLFMNKKFSDTFGGFFGVVLDDTDRVDYAFESEALRVRDFGFDDLQPGTLLNGKAMTQADIDALHASSLGVGPDGQDAGLNFFNAARNTSRDYERDRQTLTTGLQWASGNWDVNFDWTYGQETNDQYLRRYALSPANLVRSEEDTVTSMTIDFGDEDFTRSTPTLGTVMAFDFHDARGGKRVYAENRFIPRDQDIHVGGINVDWSNDQWTVNGDIGYAKQDTEWYENLVYTELNSDYRNRYNSDLRFERLNGSFDATGPGGYPVATLIGMDADGNLTPFDPTDPDMVYFRKSWRTHSEESADDVSARLDFTRELDNRKFLDAVMFGIAWNERNGTRSRSKFRQDSRVSNTHIDIAREDLIDGYETFLLKNFLPDNPGAIHDMVFLSNNDPVFDPLWVVPDDEFPEEPNRGYDVTEAVTAFYLQLPFSGEIYRGNIGLRYVKTDQTGISQIQGTTLNEDGTALLTDWETRVTKGDYDDVLPSFNIAFDLTEDWVMRFAANKALTRADPKELSSYVDLNTFEDVPDGDDEGSGSGGNPYLEPYYTNSFDASFEWYPEAGGAYALGFFYKDIDGWIADGRSTELFTAPVGKDGNGDGIFDPDDITDGIPGNGGDYYEVQEDPYSIRRKVNTDGGTIKGFELAFHTPFDSFSDGFWQYFGVNGSLTYVDAKMDAVVPENLLPISLRGTSEWSGNLVAYFERMKFATRLAFNYRDDFLFQEAEDPNRSAEWTKGSTIIDLNMDYRFTKNLLLRFSANNLTGETRVRYWQTTGTNRFSDLRDSGQYYTLELRWHN